MYKIYITRIYIYIYALIYIYITKIPNICSVYMLVEHLSLYTPIYAHRPYMSATSFSQNSLLSFLDILQPLSFGQNLATDRKQPPLTTLPLQPSSGNLPSTAAQTSQTNPLGVSI